MYIPLLSFFFEKSAFTVSNYKRIKKHRYSQKNPFISQSAVEFSRQAEQLQSIL
jgi:hypothetical protein